MIAEKARWEDRPGAASGWSLVVVDARQVQLFDNVAEIKARRDSAQPP